MFHCTLGAIVLLVFLEATEPTCPEVCLSRRIYRCGGLFMESYHTSDIQHFE